MKKKSAVIVTVSVIVMLVFLSVWLKASTIFLHSVNARGVSVIRVRDGNNGEVFEITDKESIRYIVESIQGQRFKKDRVSLGYTGTWFHLSFCNEREDVISQFFINSADTVRKEPFFYKTEEGALQNIIDYLERIEEEIKTGTVE